MSVRYAAMAMTGLNDPSKILKCADEDPPFWDAFADAKAAVITRAEIVRKYLDSAACGYEMRSESGDHHYEVSFEYGPSSLDPPLPFKMVVHVYKCADRYGRIQVIEP
jgi:hypothetical protein